MTVRYTLDKKDAKRCARRAFTLFPSFRKSLAARAIKNALGFFFFFLIVFILRLIRSEKGLDAQSIAQLTLFFFAAALVLGAFLTGMNAVEMILALQKDLLESFKTQSKNAVCSITSETVILAKGDARLECSWKEIPALFLFKDYAYLLIAREGIESIPLFKLGDKRDMFVRELRAYIRPEAIREKQPRRAR